MSVLDRRNPIQLVLGCLVRQEELARKKGQMTFAVMSADAAGWASEIRDVLVEIVADAQWGQDRCSAAWDDGVVTQEELAEIEAVLALIEREAAAGKILQGRADGSATG
jgi:hypothetical protein